MAGLQREFWAYSAHKRKRLQSELVRGFGYITGGTFPNVGDSIGLQCGPPEAIGE